MSLCAKVGTFKRNSRRIDQSRETASLSLRANSHKTPIQARHFTSTILQERCHTHQIFYLSHSAPFLIHHHINLSTPLLLVHLLTIHQSATLIYPSLLPCRLWFLSVKGPFHSVIHLRPVFSLTFSLFDPPEILPFYTPAWNTFGMNASFHLNEYKKGRFSWLSTSDKSLRGYVTQQITLLSRVAIMFVQFISTL